MEYELRSAAAQIVAAYVSRHKLTPDAIGPLIGEVYRSLTEAQRPAPVAPKPFPAVPIKRSLTHDRIICLEDGARLKSLKRYLRTRFGLTPEQYRTKWGLPADYPMVAPAYSEARSALAKSLGLGRNMGNSRKAVR